MKLKGRKATVFFINLFVLVGLYALTLIFGPEQLPSVGTTIIIMIVGNGAAYLGGKVADDWQKSKYWRSELDGK